MVDERSVVEGEGLVLRPNLADSAEEAVAICCNLFSTFLFIFLSVSLTPNSSLCIVFICLFIPVIIVFVIGVLSIFKSSNE